MRRTHNCEGVSRQCVMIRAWQYQQEYYFQCSYCISYNNLANFMIEASGPTMILFCVKSAKMLLIFINGRRFGPVAFISARFRMRILESLRHLSIKLASFRYA